MADEWVTIARLGRPHGVRGEIKAWPFDTASETLFLASSVWIKPKDGGKRSERDIKRCRATGKCLVLTFDHVETREAAAALNGSTVSVRTEALPELGEEEFYYLELVGLRVERDGEPVGKVARVEDNGAHEILVVRDKAAGIEFTIPFVDAMVEVDKEAQVVHISPPEGLVEATATPVRGR
jgi:16S rRNA processing protein RimM